MKSKINTGPPWSLRIPGGLLAALGAAMLALPGISMANLTAGTTISNTATVNFDDTGGVAQAPVNSNTIDVTVALVGAVSWGAAPTGQTVPSGAALPSAYTLTLINGGNGTDTFTLTDNTTESTPANLTASTISITSANPVTLAGTIADGVTKSFAGGVTTISVYYVDTATLTAGTTMLRIGLNDYTVAAGSTSTQIVVTGDATGETINDGTQIGEVATITFNGSAGTLSGSTLETHDHVINATGTSQGGNAQANVNSPAWSTTVTLVSLTVQKYVRNVTDNNDNLTGVGCVVVNGGATYCTSGVTGNADPDGAGPGVGDTLEYAVVITNTGGGNADNVVFTDTLSTFTTYVANSLQLDTNGDNVYDRQIAAETAGVDAGGVFQVVGQNITVQAGTSGDESVAPSGGTIIPAGTSVILYQVTIN